MNLELTNEQIAIVNSTGNILINAVAGSGKTSTLIAYAKARPVNKRILYLAFNKTVREEATRKFAEAGLRNVTVETAHSLAYHNVVRKNGYTVRNSYKTHELVKILGLQTHGEKHVEYIAANHILKFAACFCNSRHYKVQDVDYRAVVADEKARSFVNSCYPFLEKQTRRFLAKMDKGEIEVTHDFYLKKFQLSEPMLHFDYILFDEGQDASEVMLDIFMRQPATKVIVGDTHQQIYGWRFAVNSLQKVNFPLYQLSNSFRFGKNIAELAENIIGRKSIIGGQCAVTVTGSGTCNEIKNRAIIARSNLSLLLKAINYTATAKRSGKLYFEGNFSSYTYAEDGASLYDVLNLELGKKMLIRDPLIREMQNLTELEEYIEKTEDAQLSMMAEIVKKYGRKIPEIIKDIKSRHAEKREDAELIFSTVHRSKGMEYDQVELADDFITTGNLLEYMKEKDKNELTTARKLEEINLLYVAVTRAKNKLLIPETFVDDDFPVSEHIELTKKEEKETEDDKEFLSWITRKEKSRFKPAANKAYILDEVRKSYRSAYGSWTGDLDDRLTKRFCEGTTINELAAEFGRTEGAIRSRIKKLELHELYG